MQRSTKVLIIAEQNNLISLISGGTVTVKVAQSSPTLWDPMDYTVHGILQARILESIAVPFSRGSSQPMDWPQVSTLQADSLPTELSRKPLWRKRNVKKLLHEQVPGFDDFTGELYLSFKAHTILASQTQWTWVWVNSGSWRWTEMPGVLQSTGSQRVRQDWVTKLNWLIIPKLFIIIAYHRKQRRHYK